MVFKSTRKKQSSFTLYKYICDYCGYTDYMRITDNYAHCSNCSESYPMSPLGVIFLNQQMTEQNLYFDNLYNSGYSHTKDKFQNQYKSAFQGCIERANAHLNLCGLDNHFPLAGKSFLDAACGSGWLTAGLMQNKNITNSSFNAFDISSEGLEMLANFAKRIKNSNRLEMSVQNAEKIKFSDAAFDVIFGSSMLHHLDSYETFLKECYRILKPDGIALFGEPLAIGYGLSAASLLLAQKDLGTHYKEIEDNYHNISFRIRSPRNLLNNLVDKHLFFQTEFTIMAQKIGFRSVNFVSSVNREYYRDQFITNELHDRGISDIQLTERANSIYRHFFDVFDSDSFTQSIACFIYIVLSP